MTIFAGILLFAIAILAILIQFLSMFYRMPIQASIRTLIGLIVLLVGTLAMPTLEGTIQVSLDWGRILSLESESIEM